ncbi:MAG: DUF4157 domain-containing protein [Planctomycetota bacterium]
MDKRFGHDFKGMPVHASARAVIQPKLTVNTPGDKYEQEANRVAAQILRMPDEEFGQNSTRRSGSAVEPKCATCGDVEGSPFPKERSSTRMQRQCDKCAEELDAQSKPTISRMATPGTEANSVAPAVQDGIHSIRGGGAPLPQSERSFFEPRFRANFGAVRIHAGSRADSLADMIQARAFTVGQDVVFRSGEYSPGTAAGRGLLAHELTHVVQQGGGRSAVQRTVTLTDPAGAAPQPAGFMGPPPDRATLFQGWLDELCSAGSFSVDAATGAVTSTSRATFCGATPTRGQAHQTTSTTPTGCECLCEATETGAGSKTIEVQIDENIAFTSAAGASVVPLTVAGGAATAHVGADDKVVASRGFGFATLTGAGDTSPRGAGTGIRNQSVRIPDWLAFGHELCGHALPQAGVTREEHFSTPQGDRSAIDIENQLRREHSTVADSLGIRHGQFRAPNAAGVDTSHEGSVYRVASGETLSGIATKLGIPVADMLDHIWRSNSDRITAATQGTLAAGEELLIEGIDWHEVISGENLSSIATIWNISLGAIKRANPLVTGPSFTIRPGDRLLIPAN